MNKFFFLLICFCAALPSLMAQSTYEEFGNAAYYADRLHGLKTTSGEKYDKNAMTCAHKELAFGTYIKVTRMDNKKSVVVRVNDRGPFVAGSIVDISGKAAKELGIVGLGKAKVKIEVVPKPDGSNSNSGEPRSVATAAVSHSTHPSGSVVSGPPSKAATTTAKTVVKTTDTPQVKVLSKPESVPVAVSKPATEVVAAKPVPPTPVAATKGAFQDSVAPQKPNMYSIQLAPVAKAGFAVQVLTVSNPDVVLKEVEKLQAIYPGKVLTKNELSKDGRTFYKLLVGPFPDKKAADNQKKDLSKKGYKGTFVVTF